MNVLYENYPGPGINDVRTDAETGELERITEPEPLLGWPTFFAAEFEHVETGHCDWYGTDSRCNIVELPE